MRAWEGSCSISKANPFILIDLPSIVIDALQVLVRF